MGLRCLLTSMTSLLEMERLGDDRREGGARRGERERRRMISSSMTVVSLAPGPRLKQV